MEAFGVEQEIRSTLNRRVDLPSGGYLIFDYAEAFTVIDVNTGRFVGSRSKKSGARLEDTITKNNLEAVKEVVRQLRLRDIGGIIVIDFIDMANPKNRAAVEEALREELERDRTKTYVVEISPLGLVEMTRQNVTDGPREVMTRKCPTCGGDGIVVSEDTAAVEVERRLRALVTPGLARRRRSRSRSTRRSRGSLVGPGGVAAARARGDDEAPLLPRRQSRTCTSTTSRVLDQGTLEKLAPQAAGRGRPGARAEARRGRPARSARRRRQGRRRRRRRRRRGEARRQEGARRSVTARARTASPTPSCVAPAEAGDEPLTAEAEAEKPTRARRSAAAQEARGGGRRGGRERAADERRGRAGATPRRTTSRRRTRPRPRSRSEAAAGRRRRTRRGSRGGRNRKKKPPPRRPPRTAASPRPRPRRSRAGAGASEPEPEPERSREPRAGARRPSARPAR